MWFLGMMSCQTWEVTWFCYHLDDIENEGLPVSILDVGDEPLAMEKAVEYVRQFIKASKIMPLRCVFQQIRNLNLN